jgi:hypothetical protein
MHRASSELLLFSPIFKCTVKTEYPKAECHNLELEARGYFEVDYCLVFTYDAGGEEKFSWEAVHRPEPGPDEHRVHFMVGLFVYLNKSPHHPFLRLFVFSHHSLVRLFLP